MGAGASAGLAAAVQASSEDDLKAIVAAMSPEDKAKLKAAMAASAPAAPSPEAPTKKGYVYGFFDMKNMEEFKTVYSPMAEPTLEPYGGKFIMKHAIVPALAAKMGMKE